VAVAAGCALAFAAAAFWTAVGAPGCEKSGCSTSDDCDDGVFCNGPETCFRGGCLPGTGNACDDGRACSTDSCDEAADTCSHVALDVDGDTFADAECGGDDCDDANAEVHPGATEICNDVDDDCDGTIWEDHDGDGHLDPVDCPATGDDCNDEDAYTYPGAPEPCGGGDQNCSGGTGDEADTDGDGSTDVTCGGHDCDDEDPDVRPGAGEECNGKDDDCDGFSDEGFACRRGEADVACLTTCGSVGQGRCTSACERPIGSNCEVPLEECANGEDDDCDGETDEGCPTADGGCTPVREICGNTIDDDCDTQTDETDCRHCPVCGAGAFRYCDAGTSWGWGIQQCSADGAAWGACSEESPPPGCPVTPGGGWDLACCERSGQCCRGTAGHSSGLGCAPTPGCA